MSNNKHLQNEWRRWTAKLREDAAGRLVHPNGLVATLERDADGRPNVGVWRCAIPQSGEAGEQFVYPVVLRFSSAFPQEPPDVRFEPPVWHPNVDPQTGALGLPAFLDAQQRPETSVEAILEQIQRVFERPQPSPVLNEQAAYIRNYHFDTYEQIVRSQSHRFAAAVILKAFDLSCAALQTAFCALPTAPPPLSPGDSSDSSADRPGPSTRLRAAPERNLKRLLEAGRWGLKPSVGPPAPTAAQPPFGIPIDAPFADATAKAAAQPSTAPSTTAPPTAGPSLGPFVFAPSAEALVTVKEVREHVQTKPVGSPAAPPAASPNAPVIEQPPTSAPRTEVPAAQQPTAPLVVAPAIQQPPPPTTNSASKPASAPVPLLETPVVEKDGKTTIFIPRPDVVDLFSSKVVPSSQASAGATDRTTYSTSKTIVAKQPTTSATAAPPVAPAQATTAPLTAQQPPTSSNVAPPTSTNDSSSKPSAAPVPSTKAAAKGPREQTTTSIPWAGAFHFGATTGATANHPIPSALFSFQSPVAEASAASLTALQASISAQQASASALLSSLRLLKANSASSAAEQPPNSAPSAGTTAQPPTAAPVVQPPATTTTNPPPAPPEVAPFALHADAIFRELQAAGRSDLALRLRQKVVAVVSKFDEKLSDELERKEKPPVRQTKPAAGAKPQPPKRPPVVYGANHLWTDESEDEAEKREERPTRRPAVQHNSVENRRQQQPRDERDTNSPHVNLLGEPLPLQNGPQLPPEQSYSHLSHAPPKPPVTALPIIGGYYSPPAVSFTFGDPKGLTAVSAGKQQHAPPAASAFMIGTPMPQAPALVEAPKRPSPAVVPAPPAQPDERKELEDEVERLLKVQQDFIVQQRKEQGEWQKRLDELKAAPTAPIDQPKEQAAAYEELLMQKLRAIWTEEDRRQQAAVSTARPAQKTKETRTKKTAEQKRQRAKKQATEGKTAVEETVARAKAQGDLLYERLRKMQDELQQQAEEPTAQPAVQETNEAPIQPLTNEQKPKESEGTVALRKPNQDLLMHVQMPTSQLQQRAEESGLTEGSSPDMRVRIQQQLQRFLSQQPAVEVVACWVENPDGSTVPIAPAAPSTPAARIEEEPRPSTSKEPESPAYSIVNLLDSEDETGWTDAEDVEFIDSDHQ